MRLDDLTHGPEGDALAVREASPLPPGGQAGPVVDVAEQLTDQTALAEPRLALNHRQLDRLGRHRLVEDALEQRQVDLPADERRGVRAGEIAAEPGARRERLEHAHGLSLALH